MQQRSSVLVALLAIVVVSVQVTSAYNEDRRIYKWSPLWFNAYLRRGVLHKRFNDDSTIYKWSPLWLDTTAAALQRLHEYKREVPLCLVRGVECAEAQECCSGACHQGVCTMVQFVTPADDEGYGP